MHSPEGGRESLDAAKMSPPARQYYESVFLQRYREVQQEIGRTPLAVLVWGPGNESGEDPYRKSIHNKRLQIRETLLSHGYAAVFSEEVDQDSPSQFQSLKTRELAQSIAADFIVVVIGSPGSIAEVHDFGGFLQELGRKMLIFIDSSHADGYSFQGALQELNALYGNVAVFQYPSDIKECHLLTAVEQRLTVLRIAKWRTKIK